MAMHWLRSTIWFMRFASSLCSTLWSAAAPLTAASAAAWAFSSSVSSPWPNRLRSICMGGHRAYRTVQQLGKGIVRGSGCLHKPLPHGSY